jgi:hypothetical protein
MSQNNKEYPDRFSVTIGYLPENDIISLYADGDLAFTITDAFADQTSYSLQTYGKAEKRLYSNSQRTSG